MNDIGLCGCGCGEPTRIALRDRKECGWIKGQPIRFINGHQNRGPNSHFWKNIETRYSSGGYVLAYAYGHPRAHGNRAYKHILIAEKVLGKPLPPKAVIHHLDENPANNKNNNIVICENTSYHHLLHIRQRAKAACGHVHWRKCQSCKKYESPEKLKFAIRGEDSSTIVLHKNGCPKGSFAGRWAKKGN